MVALGGGAGQVRPGEARGWPAARRARAGLLHSRQALHGGLRTDVSSYLENGAAAVELALAKSGRRPFSASGHEGPLARARVLEKCQ